MKNTHKSTILNANIHPPTKFDVCFLLLGVCLLVFSVFALKSNAEPTVVEIGTKEQLIKFQQDIQNKVIPSDTDAKLTADIDLSSAVWTPIHVSAVASMDMLYTGTFDGNGHTISGLKNIASINIGEHNIWGFILFLGEDGVLKNLTISGNISEKETNQIGTFAYTNYGTIENCISNCNINAAAVYIGGIAANNSGIYARIKNCINNGNISANISTDITLDITHGGIAGYNSEGIISMCVNRGNINGDQYVGGIVGWAEKGRIDSSTNTGDLSAKDGMDDQSSAGGIIGDGNMLDILNCMNSGSVKGNSAGGIAGYSWDTNELQHFTGCTNTGMVHAFASGGVDGHWAGGIVGYADNVIMNSCTNTGLVTSEPDGDENSGAGSIVGTFWQNLTMSNCGFTGEKAYQELKDLNGKVTVDEESVLSFDAKILDAKAVTTLSVMPSVNLAPGTKGAFTLMVNGRPATSEDIRINKITAVKSGDAANPAIANIGDFENGTAPAGAIAYGATAQGYSLSFNPTDYKKLKEGQAEVAMEQAISFDARLFVNVQDEIKEPAAQNSSGSGGCNAGFAALALLAVIPAVMRRKK